MFHRAVDVDLVQTTHNPVFKTVAKAGELAAFLGHLFGRNRASLAKADDAGDIQRARTHAAFVSAAINNGRDLNPRVFATYVQRSDALWTIDLVRGDRHQVDVVLVYVDGHLPHGLN